jgi:hypothetical protein
VLGIGLREHLTEDAKIAKMNFRIVSSSELTLNPDSISSLYCYRGTKTNMLVERTAVSSGEFEVLEGREHLAAEGLVMKVERVDIVGRTAALWASDCGQHRFEDLFAQDKQCGEGSNPGPLNAVTAAVSDAPD